MRKRPPFEFNLCKTERLQKKIYFIKLEETSQDFPGKKVLIDWPKDGREIGLLSFVIDSTSYEDINRLILKLEQILTHFLSALVNTSPGNLVLFRSVQFWSSYGGKGDENLDGVPPLARPPEARLPFRLVLGRPWLDFCLLFFYLRAYSHAIVGYLEHFVENVAKMGLN